MSFVDLISIASVVVAILCSIFIYGLYKKMRRFSETKNEMGINSTRERIENQIYTAQQQLLDDTYNFVDTNKLLIKYASDSPFSKEIPNYSFFESMGIQLKGLQESESKAFCLMPFHKQYYPIYKAIKKACEDLGISCHRSDEHFEAGNLLRQIIQYIVSSRFIFAVLDGRNPNVFYEIGIAHAIGKPVFLIANYNQRDKLPFDITSSRLILYKNYEDLEKSIEMVINSNLTDDTRRQEQNSINIGTEN